MCPVDLRSRLLEVAKTKPPRSRHEPVTSPGAEHVEARLGFVKGRLPIAPRQQPMMTVVATVWLGLSLVACGTAGQTTDPSSVVSSSSSSTVTSVNELTSSTGNGDRDQKQRTEGEDMVAVIVDLSLDWQPEAELDSEEAVAEQRQAIRDTQDAIVEMLDGTEFEINRLYQATPQMALVVDAEAFDRLNESQLVANVNEDVADPSGG